MNSTSSRPHFQGALFNYHERTSIFAKEVCWDPPDPINDVCSLTGKYMLPMYFTYYLVQISKIMFRRFLFPESDPPHKIMPYWVYFSTQLSFGFQSGRICHSEMICIGGKPVLKRYFGGAGPSIFYTIHRGGRLQDVESLFRLLAAPLLATDRRFCRSLRTAVHNRLTSKICTNPDLNAGSANSKATFVLGD